MTDLFVTLRSGARFRVPEPIKSRGQGELKAQAILSDPAGHVLIQRDEKSTVYVAARLVEKAEVVEVPA